ncbi:hypothetical protein [Nostoc sp.]
MAIQPTQAFPNSYKLLNILQYKQSNCYTTYSTVAFNWQTGGLIELIASD